MENHNLFNNILDGLSSEGSHRKDLSELRSLLFDLISKRDHMIQKNLPVEETEEEIRDFYALLLDRIDLFPPFLKDSDAKTRKNAALLLAELLPFLDDSRDPAQKKYLEQKQIISRELFSAYSKEETLYVRAAYLKALSACDCRPYLSDLRDRLTWITEEDWKEEDRKHIREERRALESILSSYEGSVHSFRQFRKSYEMLFLAEKALRPNLVRDLGGNARETAGGVRVRLSDERLLETIRYYKESWFLIPVKKNFVLTMDRIGEIPSSTALLSLLDDLLVLRGSDDGEKRRDPYSFRLEIRSKDQEDQVEGWIKRAGYELEETSHGRLRNLPGNYEFTLILIKKRDGSFAPFLRLNATDRPFDQRFSYRIYSEASSTAPIKAAEAVEMIRPYLGERAQIIDPFCGVGTLLIERDKALSAREIYGTDTFGQAIREGRENAEKAGVRINFINRDFFDFRHDYLFDEVITECPDLYGKTAEEKDSFYRSFFDQCIRITTDRSILFLLSKEEGQIQKQIRLHPELKLVRTMELRRRQNIYIIEKR